MLPSVTAFQAKITLDPELWRAIKICVQNSEELDLDPIDRRLMDEIVKDFEELINLSDERKRLKKFRELAKVTQSFSENVLDATNEWSITATEESELVGLPNSAKSSARQTT